MTPEEVIESLEHGERINVECKEAQRKLPRSLWETYSAFANTAGGVIFLGIKEDFAATMPSKRFQVTGVTEPEKMRTDFWNAVENPEIVSVNILADSDVDIVRVEDKQILAIRVPPASYSEKPVYAGKNPYAGTYRRRHEGDYHCGREAVDQMIRDRRQRLDFTLLPGYSVPRDIDMEAVASYRNIFRIYHLGHSMNALNDDQFLERLGVCRKTRGSETTEVTVAGLLMFGKGASMREVFPNIRPDYLDLTHLIPGMRWSDRVTDDGTWETNLFNFVQRVVPKLTRDIPRPFRLNGVIRVDDTPVHAAVREALINMVIHCDYYAGGVLRITKDDLGFEFSNPGPPLLSIGDIYVGGTPVSRNPELQRMFRMIGYGDNIGSGFPAILDTWRDHQWRLPDLHVNDANGATVLRLWTVADIPEGALNAAKEMFPGSISTLTDRETTVLIAGIVEGSISVERTAALLKSDRLEAKKAIGALARNGMLRRVPDKEIWTLSEGSGNVNADKSAAQPKNLTERQILELIRNREEITASDVLRATGLKTRSGANAALRRMAGEGLIKRKRAGREYRYSAPDRGDGVKDVP